MKSINAIRQAVLRERTVIYVVVLFLILFTLTRFKSIQSVRLVKEFLYLFDYHHWPAWYAINLWVVAGGMALFLLLNACFVQKYLHQFHNSPFWQRGIALFKQSKFNKWVVRVFMYRRCSRWLLYKWMAFWQAVKVENYPLYIKYLTEFLVLLITFHFAEWLVLSRLYIWRMYQFIVGIPYSYIYEPLCYAPLTRYMYDGTFSWRILIAPTTGLLMIYWLLRWNQHMKRER